MATLLWKGNLQGKIYSMGDPSFIALSRKSELQRFHGLLSLLLGSFRFEDEDEDENEV